MIKGIKGILYRELIVLKGRIFKFILSSSVSPLLFLLAFGYGVGGNSDLEGIPYVVFLLPGLITMSSMNQAYSISTEINIARFYFKTFEEYLLAPINQWEIVAGEAIYGIIKGLLSALIIIVISLFLNIKLSLNVMFWSVMFLHLLAFSLLGIIIALIVKNHGDQFAFNTFIITPMIFLSGTFFPIDKMPLIVKYFAYIFPLTYSNELIRGSLLNRGINIYHLIILLIFCAVLFFTALRIVKKTEA